MLFCVQSRCDYETNLGIHFVLVWNGNAVDVHHWEGTARDPADRRGASAFVLAVFLQIKTTAEAMVL
jgi:hypothetical protein